VKDQVKILMIEDDEEDYLITRDILREIGTDSGYELEWIPGYEEAARAVAAKQHDVYLVDYKLGAHTGLELISQFRNKNFKAPFILLTGLRDWQVAESALTLGASDYLVKGTFGAEELNRVLRYNLRDAMLIEEIRALNADLENRVQERTLQLAQTIEQLASSNEHLQKLLREREMTQAELRKALEKERELGVLKSRFVTMASHEFKTPLSTILSSTYLLEKYSSTEDNDKRLKHLERIRITIKNLTDILNDFLSAGKIEDNKMPVERVPFSAQELIENAIKEIEVLLKPDQRIVCQLSMPQDLRIISDPKIFKNILLNLLSNAVKYSEAGTGIYLQAKTGGGNLEIAVKDSGIGIPEKDKAHMFERFFRAENAVNVQGTGLGLNLVKKYVELLSGDITFESELDKGTTFMVKIPLAAAASATPRT
jgi:signal transduction histidine kinase